MITVVIPTLNAERVLAATLTALVPAAVEGLVREVIIVDGGSSDHTARIVEAAGAELVTAQKGRGSQLAAGAKAARQPWLLFLHADTVLEAGWESEALAFIERVDGGARPESAAAFKFSLDDIGFAPRALETLVSLRCLLLRLPYGDQGLLVPRRLYESVGGYQPLPLMEDVAMVRGLGRKRIVMLRSRATTSAVRFRRDGYLLRSLRNMSCVALFLLRVPTRHIVRLYG
ncbi:MAG: TIGR04283 family arsenosugar biosynthesis glycosyltransferase [Hyphomicrobiaceae bacterium]